MGKGPKFIPEAFDGTHAPPGADPEALREMRRMQRESRGEAAPAAAPKGTTGQRAADRRRPPPDELFEEQNEAPAGSPASHSRGGRPAKGSRTQRVVRLTAQVDTRLRQLADFRGIDLNAAISVAIAEDWRRVFDLDLLAGRRQ